MRCLTVTVCLLRSPPFTSSPFPLTGLLSPLLSNVTRRSLPCFWKASLTADLHRRKTFLTEPFKNFAFQSCMCYRRMPRGKGYPCKEVYKKLLDGNLNDSWTHPLNHTCYGKIYLLRLTLAAWQSARSRNVPDFDDRGGDGTLVLPPLSIVSASNRVN